jgi:N-acetylglucosamine-6-sulfatase
LPVKSKRVIALVLAVLGTAVMTAAFADGGSSAAPKKPNIILILTDDLSWNLVQFMPNVKRMQQQGVTFGRYYIANSLCCPSRATILTGKFSHNTGIFTNGGRNGGFNVFHSRGEENSTFATRLHSAGYRTALMGKYLNGYKPTLLVDGAAAYIPPGWDEWDVGGNAYENYGYLLNENGALAYHGRQPSDYLTDVLAAKGSFFIADAAARRQPFLLQIATYTPHSPYTPAIRHLGDFPRARAPRTPAFDEADIRDKPSWLINHSTLRRTQVSNIDAGFRKRAQSVEAIDELIGSLQEALRANKQLSNTYIFFTSDNGYHMGEHRLAAGKQTAFETDIRVPLIVTGPAVARGETINKLTSNIDLYPTFVRLAGSTVPPLVDGRSLVPLLAGEPVANWRKAVLVEHHGLDMTRGDPDFQGPYAGNPRTYEAIRTANGTYVEYSNNELEYYDMKRDRYQLDNAASTLTVASADQLHARVEALSRCRGGLECWVAAGGG